MIPYSHTKIPVKETKEQINSLLMQYGVNRNDIAWLEINGKTTLKFAHQVAISGKVRNVTFSYTINVIKDERQFEYEPATYRLLYYLLKNKLLAVKYKFETIETELMSHIQVGTVTIGEKLTDNIAHGRALEDMRS